MKSLITPYIKVLFAKNLLQRLETSDNYYLCFGYIDNNKTNKELSFKEILDNVIFARKLKKENTKLGIHNNIWTSGKVYQKFDGQELDIEDKEFYVTSNLGDKIKIYKLIDMNNDTDISTAQPNHSIGIETYPDGYQWKFICELNLNDCYEFIDYDFIPIINSDDIAYELYANSILTYLNIPKVSTKEKYYFNSLCLIKNPVDKDGSLILDDIIYNGIKIKTSVKELNLNDSIEVITNNASYIYHVISIINKNEYVIKSNETIDNLDVNDIVQLKLNGNNLATESIESPSLNLDISSLLIYNKEQFITDVSKEVDLTVLSTIRF